MKKTPPRHAPASPAEDAQAPGAPQAAAEEQPAGTLAPSEIARVLLEAEPPAEAPTATVSMPVKDLDLAQAEEGVPRLDPGASTETLSLRLAGGAAEAGPACPARITRGRWWILAACLLAGAGAAAIWMLHPRAPGPTAAAEADLQGAAPPELRPYLDQAAKGDAKAMHMIALMYWNGLNVRQDRAKGLAWYRKAAAAGDKAAQQELGIIEAK